MSIFRITTTDTTAISPTLYSRSQKVKEGLKLILGHFDGEPLWPRTVSTRNTNGRQIAVNNTQEVMTLYAAANYLDCRMNAYPQYTNFHIDRTGIAPSLLLVAYSKPPKSLS